MLPVSFKAPGSGMLGFCVKLFSYNKNSYMKTKMDEKLKEPFTDIETAAIAVGSHITPYREWPLPLLPPPPLILSCVRENSFPLPFARFIRQKKPHEWGS